MKHARQFKFSSWNDLIQRFRSWCEGECVSMIVKSRLPFDFSRSSGIFAVRERLSRRPSLKKFSTKRIYPEYTSPSPTQKYLSYPTLDSFLCGRSPSSRVCEEGGLTDECFSDIGNTLAGRRGRGEVKSSSLWRSIIADDIHFSFYHHASWTVRNKIHKPGWEIGNKR